MKSFVISCFLIFTLNLYGNEANYLLKSRGLLGRTSQQVYDPKVNYTEQVARVSDYDDTQKFYKLHFQNNNVKFLKKGDILKFRILNTKGAQCQGQVQKIENFFITVKVANLAICWRRTDYFRRGTLLKVSMPIMDHRVYEAVSFRKVLVQQKSDFLRQLQGINNFLYNYDQEKVKLMVNYEERMARLMEEKKKALRALQAKRQESYQLRQVLSKKLDKLDHDLRFYQVEREEQLVDRWDLSHDQGLPLSYRPQKPIK